MQRLSLFLKRDPKEILMVVSAAALKISSIAVLTTAAACTPTIKVEAPSTPPFGDP